MYTDKSKYYGKEARALKIGNNSWRFRKDFVVVLWFIVYDATDLAKKK